MRWGAFFLLGVLALALQASAAQYYISPLGSDSNNGTSEQSPFLTLSKALNASSSGDSINAATGNYTGSENVGLSVVDRTISGASTSGTVFEGDNSDPFSTSGAVVFENLTLKGAGGDGVNVLSGSIMFADVHFSAFSGAVYLYPTTTNVTVTRCNFDSSSNFGIYAKCGAASVCSWEIFSVDNCTFSTYGLAIRISIDSAATTPDFSLFSVSNCEMRSLISISWDAGGATSSVISDCTFKDVTTPYNGGISSGSVIALYTHSQFTLRRCTFVNNTATGDGGAVYCFDSSKTGPATSFLVVEDCFFSGNTAQGSGGAINSQGFTVTLTRSIFVGNSAVTGNGGAVEISGFQNQAASANIASCTFISNTADNVGGAVRLDNFAVSGTVSDSSMISNSCSKGALDFTYCDFNVTAVTLISNSGLYGGGLHVGNGGAVTSNALSFFHNMATYRGGAAYLVDGSRFTASATLMANNTAANHGGGLYLESGASASLQYVSFLNNNADYGGGFSVDEDGVANLASTVIKGNSAAVSGGGFYCDGGVNLDNSTISANDAPQGSAYTCTRNCGTSLTNTNVDENNSAYGCDSAVSAVIAKVVEAMVAAQLSQLPQMTVEDALQLRAHYGK